MNIKLIHYIFKVCYWVTWASLIIICLWLIGMMIVGEPVVTRWDIVMPETVSAKSQLLQMPDSVIKLYQGEVTTYFSSYVLMFVRLVTTIVTGTLWILFFKHLQLLIEQISIQNPFSNNAINDINWLRSLSLIIPLWQLFQAYVWPLILINHLSIDRFSPLPIFSIKNQIGETLFIQPAIDYGLLLAGIFFYLLLYVFNYGNELQADSDEVI
ncbi:hypothetical protein [Thalassotalea hakodatensis]|uniref:hypothetical protein n=1 Tax=Thalassotalea hakodatensis TaxID=3030492 RepID=UPI0025743E20|nr:hypothetical protein [Thalassotalea hakodatensis]